MQNAPTQSLNKQELLIAALAAWEFRETNRFPSEVVCEHRGTTARTPEGAESPESVEVWHGLAAALGITPTAYLRLLMSEPEKVARGLLRARAGIANSPEDAPRL